MKASTRRRLRSVATAIGVGLLAITFAGVFVVERLLYGLHVGAKACRSTLANWLPSRSARSTPATPVTPESGATPESAPPAVRPRELDDGLRPLPSIEEPVPGFRKGAA